MNNAALFKQAHALTKATIKVGDSYQATFGMCLRHVIEQNKAQTIAMVEAKEKAKFSIKAILTTMPEAIYQLSLGAFCVGILAAFVMFTLHVATNTGHALLSVAGGFVATTFTMFGSWAVAESIENTRQDYQSNANH